MSSQSLTIGILGAGPVGRALAVRLLTARHRVTFGVRDPASSRTAEALASFRRSARAVSFHEAVRDADAVILAVPFHATREVLAGAGDLTGRVLIDATNPLSDDGSSLTLGHGNSAAEEIARFVPGARVVKAFNTTGAVNMADPIYDDRPTPIFYAGDDQPAKQMVAKLIADLGSEAVDSGPLVNARLLEPLAMLWIWLAVRGGLGRGFTFQLARRPDRPLSELIGRAAAGLPAAPMAGEPQ